MSLNTQCNKVSEKVANLHKQNQSVQMIASKNDHEFISVVDLKNHKSSLVEGCTTDYRSKENHMIESPGIVNMKVNPSVKISQSSSLPMNKTLQKSNSTKLTNSLNAFQDKVVALMHQVSQQCQNGTSRVSPKITQMKSMKPSSTVTTPQTTA